MGRWTEICLKQPNKGGKKGSKKKHSSEAKLFWGGGWKGEVVLFSEKTSPEPRQTKMPAPDLVTFGFLGPSVSSQIIFMNCLIQGFYFPCKQTVFQIPGQLQILIPAV